MRGLPYRTMHTRLTFWLRRSREYVGWLDSFIVFFFIRASIMLFTLRLLPCTKIWCKRLIYFTLFLNFSITVIACVSYGMRCVPFGAIGKVNAGAKCISTEVLVSTMKLNGSKCDVF